jgi:hypothetical protein
LTPPQLAKRWRCKPESVLAKLKSGELRGFKLGNGRRRPRWRVSPEAIAAYELGSGGELASALRRRGKQPEVIEFF